MDVLLSGTRLVMAAVRYWGTPIRTEGVESITIQLGDYEELEIKHLSDTNEVCVLHKGLVDGEPNAECVFSVTREQA